MRIPDPLSAIAVSQDLRGNRTIQFLAGLMPLLIVGVICAAFMRRPVGAWLFGAMTLSGVGVGGWLARNTPSPGRGSSSANTDQAAPQSSSTTRVAPDFIRGDADVVLVLELHAPGEPAPRDAADFLSRAQPFSESQADSSLRLERRGAAESTDGQHTCWMLVARADDVTARFVQVPIGDGQTRRLTTLLRRLRLTRRHARDLLRTLMLGRSAFASPLKAVVLCCSLSDIRKHLEAVVTLAGRELNAIGASVAGQFPLYVVATDLQQVAGFAEFTAALKSRRGAAALDEAFGVALDGDERTKDGLHRRLSAMTTTLAAWRPALLAAIDAPARRASVDHSTNDSASRKALTYEFPRQLATVSQGVADFCWRAVNMAKGKSRGPMLRGVFFTGVVIPEISPFINSLAAPSQFERRAFAWNLLTRHIVGAGTEDLDCGSH